MSRTIVSFHAHPDDETLLTGGTLARLAAEGNRVVLVVATAGEAGLAAPALRSDGRLGDIRMAELATSADILGCARVIQLGYADSGMIDQPTGAPRAFASVPVDQPANRLADVLIAEGADLLTSYDPAGGYGHPDHVQVNRVGRRAAELAGTPVLVEATVDRDALRRALRILDLFKATPSGFAPRRFDRSYTAGELITHRVNVRPFWRQKRAAMRAHASQASGGTGDRSMAWFLRLPGPVFRMAFGREWFVEAGRPADRRPLDDLLASLR